ncbi:hypothetical protein C1I91_22615 [Clostridium manihotivorum]|uniref:ABC transmembrane type-1 domain-containing protein n=2 Tax=Clostridium manihotivorum TaxID=2320868 RepID=A0A3R5R113_9CLOT|nr:hypothetical protein C1I91_22615 [Clostridium manihotivorum]
MFPIGGDNMKKYIAKRTAQVILTAVVIVILLTTIFVHMPGDYASGFMGRELKIHMRQELGLDLPKSVQIMNLVKSILTGKLFSVNSYAYNVPIGKVLLPVVTRSLFLYGISFFLSSIISIFLGALTAWKGRSKLDVIVRIGCVLGISVPFVIMDPIIEYYLFWVKRISYDTYDQYFLIRINIVVMLLYMLPLMTKYTRAIMIDVLSKDFITTARAKGLRESIIVFRHGMKNIYTELFTIMGVNINKILFYGFLIEAIFNYPGLGTLSTFAFKVRDYPLMIGCTIVTSLVIILFNYIFDILAGLLNPLIKIE